MKKLIFTILSSSMIASSAMANNTLKMASLDMGKLVSTQKLKEIKLLDGRTLNFQKEVERLHLYENKVDYLELLNGEVVDRTDIQALRLLDVNNHMMVLRATGVDGGG